MPTTYYGHYTSSAGLVGILSHQNIWATNIKFLNDEHEFQHALDLILRILKQGRFGRGVKASSAEYAEFAKAVKKNVDTLDVFHPDSVFTLSFSAELDLLSQWRGYCPGNNGYCIVFDLEKLYSHIVEKIPGARLVKCVYDNGEKETELRKLLNANWATFSSSNDQKGKENTIQNLSKEIVKLASFFKHPSFKEEQEHRIVLLEHYKDVDIKFREGRSSLIPYIELPAPREFISRIIIGPNPHQQLAERALQAFLQKCTGEWWVVQGIEIKLSDTPYRPS